MSGTKVQEAFFKPNSERTDKARGGGGGTPLYGQYRYVRPQRVGFFSRFGHK